MNSQTSTMQMKAQPNKNTAECRKHLAITCRWKIKTKKNDFAFPAISSQVVGRKLLGLSTHRTSNTLERTGYHVSKYMGSP